ncbi:hypothetical protein ACOSQ2_003366 [Xanthoceras sorbifolium]|uniref:Uncharacterized protein n=1 Tax=Xanthoceras sorbifolium TaxID=99658 RepID=A0ABQ8GY25_9ROSI|nr:hypothetical protein JRO89_XSUnG0141000 [Xanthoceras sorbifolium]
MPHHHPPVSLLSHGSAPLLILISSGQRRCSSLGLRSSCRRSKHPLIYYNNAFYAKVGRISTAEMNHLEVDLLFGLGFQFTTFNSYCSHLHREIFLQSPLHLADPLSMGRTLVKQYHLCFTTEDESTHQQQLAV